jgi:hypothetical protein
MGLFSIFWFWGIHPAAKTRDTTTRRANRFRFSEMRVKPGFEKKIA